MLQSNSRLSSILFRSYCRVSKCGEYHVVCAYKGCWLDEPHCCKVIPCVFYLHLILFISSSFFCCKPPFAISESLYTELLEIAKHDLLCLLEISGVSHMWKICYLNVFLHFLINNFLISPLSRLISGSVLLLVSWFFSLSVFAVHNTMFLKSS